MNDPRIICGPEKSQIQAVKAGVARTLKSRLPCGAVPEVWPPGLQISLNYITKFNAKLTPNSSRDCLGGDGGLLGATCLSPRLISSLLVFSDNWPLQGGSRSIWGVEFEKCDPPFERRVALFSEWQVSILSSDVRAEI